MKVSIAKRKLKEELNHRELFEILHLIGQAHDKIMEAQDLLSDLQYEYEDEEDEELLSTLEYILDDLESALSEHDYMGEDDSVEAFKEKNL